MNERDAGLTGEQARHILGRTFRLVLLGFVLPASFHLKVFGAEMSWSGVLSDVLLVLLGLSLAVFGTYTSLLQIFHSSSA